MLTATPFEPNLFLYYYKTTTLWVRRGLEVSAITSITTSATTGQLCQFAKPADTSEQGADQNHVPLLESSTGAHASTPRAAITSGGLKRGKFCTGRHKFQK